MRLTSPKNLPAVLRRSLGVLVFLILATISTAAQAQNSVCPFCSLPIVQNTPTMDYEAVLRSGGKNVSYRCTLCAVADAPKYQGDLVIMAPTGQPGKPMALKRSGGAWTAEAGAIFLSVPVSHRKCQIANRAFRSKTEFDDYAEKNKDVVGAARPLTLAEFIKAATQ